MPNNNLQALLNAIDRQDQAAVNDFVTSHPDLDYNKLTSAELPIL